MQKLCMMIYAKDVNFAWSRVCFCTMGNE